MNVKKKPAAASDNGKLIAYLEAMIAGGRYAAGDRLPPLRKLAEQFSLTPSCAHRAIRTLCERGLLELHQGAGTFVREPDKKRSSGSGVISVAIWDSTLIQSYCAYALQGMQEAAAASSWLLKFFFVSYEQMTEQPILPRDFWKCDVAAFLGCYDLFDPVFHGIPRPCVGLEMQRMFDGTFSTVSVDPFSAAELAVRHFQANGVKEVQVVCQPMPVHRVRAEVFRQQWEAAGGSCRMIERSISQGDAPFRIDPDGACLFTGGSDYNYAARQWKMQTGKILAENPNMLGIDGKSLLLPDFEPSNTLAIDWRQAGVTVFEECRRRAENPGSAARRISIQPRLVLYRQEH
ncbi:MAG: GntR family transcriptional regulator [Lentisphaeria bacterium]|nr:GntR family transcriptional regulator [Lentisphaeria bacterium]